MSSLIFFSQKKNPPLLRSNASRFIPTDPHRRCLRRSMAWGSQPYIHAIRIPACVLIPQHFMAFHLIIAVSLINVQLIISAYSSVHRIKRKKQVRVVHMIKIYETEFNLVPTLESLLLLLTTKWQTQLGVCTAIIHVHSTSQCVL